LTPEVIIALCTALGTVVGAVVEHMRIRHHESDLRERIARCEARLDAIERK
jgi:hypothetical protein